MIEVEIDGRKVGVAEGSMVMHAAHAAGVYVPHFCYHKKLTIAANCRMCLVDVEKMPKAMPACATPATNGMVVHTQTDKALRAQKSVMEFLLINHPLDCPICDQGGECQLQDLAMGYGASASRYDEEKRVVVPKDVGPLLSMAEMTRCIHCTRCVRFGMEVGGVMELGMVHRGEHSEITPVAGTTVDSELSGNMIDLCPVGAITSKPFRFTARAWELSRRKGVSPHDSTGANLIVQVKGGRVMRVLPLENEDVNECWLADRDRFSYPALESPQRLTEPRIKQGGQWTTVDWDTALRYVADGLQRVKAEFGSDGIGAVAHPSATVEELHLLGSLVRGLGSESVDHRSRVVDPAWAARPRHARWLGMPVAELSRLDRAFVVGSFLRKDHPLLAQRLRQAVRRGAKVHTLHALRDDGAMPMAGAWALPPSRWVQALAEVAATVARAAGVPAPMPADAGSQAQAIAAALQGGQRRAVLLGNAASQHPQAAQLLALAQFIAQHTGARCGWLVDGANAVGAQLVGAVPGPGGLSAAQMLTQPMKSLLLLHTEPLLDSPDAAATRRALAASGLVVALTAFGDLDAGLADACDVMLPVSPFSETSGTFVNAEGRVQSFHGVAKPLGNSRPAWKVLRVLGNLLGLVGFDAESSEQVRAAALGDAAALAGRLDNTTDVDLAALATASPTSPSAPPVAGGFERIADVPIYASDPVVRRSQPLQQTADARAPVVGLPPALWQRLALAEGDRVRVAQGDANALLPARADATLADGVVRIAAGHPATASLGAMFGAVTIEKAS